MKFYGFFKNAIIQMLARTFRILSILPVDPKVVIFESFLGKQYSDNPRAMYEYMLEKCPQYNMYWSFDRKSINHFKDKNINSVKRFSPKWFLLMARAKYWVTNSRLPLWIPKPKHTIYIQTWHGTPLKKLATDMNEVHMPGTTTSNYKKEFLIEVQKWDYLVSPNGYSTEVFRRAFQFKKNIIESGYPRNDYLYSSNHEEAISNLKKRMGLPFDKKVILYAPTWRDNQYGTWDRIGKYKFDLELDLNKMRAELGEGYIIILRLHYLVAENVDLTLFKRFLFDFSKYEDIRDLYLVSDMLITDYSSVFFDYANLNRPIIFFVYDIEEYRDELRGFYLDFEKEAPGPLFKSTEQLINGIKEIDTNEFQKTNKFTAFRNKFCSLEQGKSTKRVIDNIFK